MARICLYPLFVLFIVFVFRLDFNDAEDFPPPGFITRCLLMVEAPVVYGIYRYDPDEVVVSGYPKMVKLDFRPGQSFDYNRVDKNYYISYWARSTGLALQFSKGYLRLQFDVEHPCNNCNKAAGNKYWEIINATEAATFEGYLQRKNAITDLECVPRHGKLISDIGYRLREYTNMRTAYACVTWLREVEATSGVKSHATAAGANPLTKTCTLFYVDHSDLSVKTGIDNYCLLKETKEHVTFPGFYTGCLIYVEHPIFAGLWELYYKLRYDSMPYLALRRAEFKSASRTEIILRDGFKDNYLARLNASEEKLQFLLDGAVGLEFEMSVHFCIGPDTEQIVKTHHGRHYSVAYRKDKGMKCVPFYGASSYEGSFEGIISVDLDVNVFHSLGRCADHFNAEYPFAEWKVIESTLNYGPCAGFGGGVDYTAVRHYDKDDTYSCFSTERYDVRIEPYSSCEYTLEAGKSSGFFLVDAYYRNNYTQYPTFTRRGDEDGTSVLMIWEDGYKVKGLGEVLTVGLLVKVCSSPSDYDSRLVMRNGDVVGRTAMVTGRRRYDIKNEYLRINSDNPGHSHFQIFGLWVLGDCIAAAEKHQKVGWKAYMRMGNVCRVWGERLDMTKLKVFTTTSDIYSYVVTKNSSLTPPELDDGCLVSVEGPTEYCGKYSMDLSFEHNFSYYPIMERKTFTITDGDIVDEESNAFIKTERTADGLVLRLHGRSKEYTISASSHMCETSHANGTKFPILNEERTEVGYVYKLDPSAESCDPLPGVWKSKNEPTASVSKDVSFADCQASLPKPSTGRTWEEMVKTDGSCKAWDDSLDSRDVTKDSSQEGCTCVFSALFFPTARISDVNRDCMVIVKDRVFHSPYAVKFVEGESNDFPLLVAKRIVRVGTSNSLTVGDFYEESEDGYRYIQYNPSSDQLLLKSANGKSRKIEPKHGFICSGDYDEREPEYSVVNKNGKTTGVLQRISGTISCEILDTTNRDQIKLVLEQGITPCLWGVRDLGIAICSYGQSKILVTCAEY